MKPVHRHAHGPYPGDLPGSSRHGDGNGNGNGNGHGGGHGRGHGEDGGEAVFLTGAGPLAYPPAQTRSMRAGGAGSATAMSAFRMSAWMRLVPVAAALALLWAAVLLATR